LKKIYDTQLLKYRLTNQYYVEVYTSVKRIVKVKDYNEERALEKASKREDRRKIWNNYGYVFIDCDYNIVKEKDYETYRQTYKKVRGRSH